MITTLVEDGIGPSLDPQRAYRLELPDDVRGSLRDLRDHGHRITVAILNNLNAVHDGGTVRSQLPGREWSFRMEAADERDWDEPRNGVRYVFDGKPNALNWNEVPDGLDHEVLRLLRSVARKFATHGNARRVLVLDLIGDLSIAGAHVLRRVFDMIDMPNEIDEVWTSTHGLITELYYGWIHQAIWPTVGKLQYELCGESVPGAQPLS